MSEKFKNAEPGLPGPILAVSCPEDRLVVCVCRDGEPLFVRERIVPGQAMRHIAPDIEEAFAAQKLSAKDLAGIACVRGPGSFTGIRLVLATALGLAQGAGVPLAGLDYLPLLAAEPAKKSADPTWVLTHARKKQVYIQGFQGPDRPVASAQAATLADAARMIRETGLPAGLMGSGLRKNLEFFEERLPDAEFLDPENDALSPAILAKAANRAKFAHKPIKPMYIRVSDAEENLPGIAAKRGLTEKEARRYLNQND